MESCWSCRSERQFCAKTASLFASFLLLRRWREFVMFSMRVCRGPPQALVAGCCLRQALDSLTYVELELLVLRSWLQVKVIGSVFSPSSSVRRTAKPMTEVGPGAEDHVLISDHANLLTTARGVT